MNDSELHNFFKVAESRNIGTVEVAKILINNGRQIYLHFIEEQRGVLEYVGLSKLDEKLFYFLESGKVYPITPESRIDLVNALRNKKKKLELKIRIEWEDGKNNNFGYYIVKVKVNLKLILVIDYEDLRFLPPLSNIGASSGPTGSAHADFFSDNFFHELVLRTMKEEETDWNTVKRTLNRHTKDDERIRIIEVTNHEGDMRPQIQFFTEDTVEPFKVMESTFKKKLTAYRKYLRQLPLPSNNK